MAGAYSNLCEAHTTSSSVRQNRGYDFVTTCSFRSSRFRGQAGDGEGHGDAVVVVRLDRRRARRSSRDGSAASRALLDGRAEAAELRGDGGQAVGFLHAQVGDVHDLDRRRRQRRDRGERRDDVGRGVAVERAAAQRSRAASPTISSSLTSTRAAHRREDVEESGVALRGGHGQSAHAHRVRALPRQRRTSTTPTSNRLRRDTPSRSSRPARTLIDVAVALDARAERSGGCPR